MITPNIKSVILKLAPQNIGEQFHFNHEDCPAGEDNRKRLYIKRTSDGVLYYCHHCQQKGFIKDKEASVAKLRHYLTTDDKLKHSATSSRIELSVTMDAKIETTLKWISQYHCNSMDDIIRTDSEGNTVLPIYSPHGTVIGETIRNHRNTDPKYLTTYIRNDLGTTAWFGHLSLWRNILFITEDWLSAYRINRDTGYRSMALLRTSISDKTIEQITEEEGITDIFLWLDSDAAGIEGARKVKTRLNLFTNCKVQIVKEYLEPKEHSTEQLKDKVCKLMIGI